MIVSNAPLGFSIRSVGRGIKRGAGAVAKAAYKPVEWTLIKPSVWLTHQAMRPVAAIVHRIRDRRAVKLAWDKRKSKTPNAAERAEAKSWTKSKLNHELPHGPILALFAGADDHLYGYYEPMAGELGVAPVIIAAAIPVLMGLAKSMLSRFSSSGEAPADPSADAASAAEGAGAGAAPGTVDLSPVQDAAADAAQGAADALEKGGHGKKGKGKLPGGLTKKQLMIGGAVVGGLALVLVLTNKKKD